MDEFEYRKEIIERLTKIETIMTQRVLDNYERIKRLEKYFIFTVFCGILSIGIKKYLL